MTPAEALKRIEEKHSVARNSRQSFRCLACGEEVPVPCDVVKLARALTALLEKLREIGASPEYRSTFTLAHIHGQPYTGPSSWDQQRRAKRVLSEVAGEEP